MTDNKEKNPYAVALGRAGGLKTAERLGKEHFIRISAIGKIKRQQNKLNKLEGVKLEDTGTLDGAGNAVVV